MIETTPRLKTCNDVIIEQDKLRSLTLLVEHDETL